MATPNFDRVWELVRTLAPDELRKLRSLADTLLAHPEPMNAEDELEILLLKEGIISRIPPPLRDLANYKEPELIEIEGEPLSETIIRERR
jgi:hypothetical protein